MKPLQPIPANFVAETILEGFLTVAIHRKGKRIVVCENRPNLLLNGAFGTDGSGPFAQNQARTFYTFTSTAANYDDPNGTWTQSNGSGGPGNTVTRVSGTGTFPAGNEGNELLWQDGERVHVTARASDTSITVSGPPRYLVGKTMRRYFTNWNSVTGTQQNATSATSFVTTDLAAGTLSQTWTAIFASATGAYSMGSIVVNGSLARIVLGAPVSVLVDDQLEMSYTVAATYSGRTQAYDLGSEATGIPTQYTASSIVGNGTYFDIVTSAANHFLAGDAILLENFTPKKFAISSGSSNSTTITVNTTLPHGLNPADAVVIEGASVSAYNSTWTVATTPTTTQFTITTAANPGALGASGTVRLATPVTYFSGAFTVASKPDASTCRITSAIQGPAIEPKTFGSTRGVRFDVWGGVFGSAGIGNNNQALYFSESNAKTIPPVTQTGGLASTSGGVGTVALPVQTNSSYSTDFTCTREWTWNAGVAEPRLKQIYFQQNNNSALGLITFTVPQSKLVGDRLKASCSIKNTRTLTPTP